MPDTDFSSFREKAFPRLNLSKQDSDKDSVKAEKMEKSDKSEKQERQEKHEKADKLEKGSDSGKFRTLNLDAEVTAKLVFWLVIQV